MTATHGQPVREYQETFGLLAGLLLECGDDLFSCGLFLSVRSHLPYHQEVGGIRTVRCQNERRKKNQTLDRA